MQSLERNSLKLRPKTPGKFLVLAIVSMITALMQGCGGTSTPSYIVPTTTSPTPGVTLQSIQIGPSIPLLALGGSRQLVAIGVYSNGASSDLTSQVTWSASSVPSPTSNIAVTSSGLATGMTVGPSVISATLGTVQGVFQLLAVTSGYSSNTTGILTVPFGKSAVDAAYQPRSLSQIEGVYMVQEVNLDADQFSNTLPVAAAVMASIPMPSGFVPNATAVSQASLLVAVISYTSPNVQVIDASNDPTDVLSNTVVSTFKSPVTTSVTFNGITCMICAAVVDPTSNQLLLSTAQGYYTMDLIAGTFTLLPFTPAALPAPSFTLNPLATNPYILSPTFGQDPPSSGELQILDLTTNAVTTDSTLGLTSPNAVAIDLSTNYAAVADAAANDQSLLDVENPLAPASTAVSNLGVCVGQTGGFNMVAVGVGANANAANIPHTLFLSQTGGSCAGLEIWPTSRTGNPPFPGLVNYAYGNIPPTPDGSAFVNGRDSSAIATFTSVVDKKNYGVLVDANQNWIAKINLQNLASDIQTGFSLPAGFDISTSFLTGLAGDPVVFLPTPASVVTLSQASINFGNQPTGTASATSLITLINTGTASLFVSQVAIQGANSGDFAETDTCSGVNLLIHAQCTINVTFTPSAMGQRSAVLSITDTGGASPQNVPLSGTGS